MRKESRNEGAIGDRKTPQERGKGETGSRSEDITG